MKIEDVYKKINKYRQIEEPQEVYDLIWKIDVDLFDKLFSNAIDYECKKPDKYVYGNDDDQIVLVEDKYDDLYMYYVFAHYDLLYQDTESYSNNMILYNNTLKELSCEFRRNHRQKRNYEIKF